jgi:hypothetical protein
VSRRRISATDANSTRPTPRRQRPAGEPQRDRQRADGGRRAQQPQAPGAVCRMSFA